MALALKHANLNPRKLLIDGKWVDAQSGKTFRPINPATAEPLCEVAQADAADIDLAVKSSRKAFDEGPWAKMNAGERGRILFKLSELMYAQADELAELETIDAGKPIGESRNVDVPVAAEVIQYYAGWASKIAGETLPSRGESFIYNLREPVGVVGAIVPWNFPLLLAMWKVGPALATGCTMVLKPSETTPLSVLKIGELALEAGLPPGVLNVVPGPGRSAGDALVAAPRRRQDRLHRQHVGGAGDHEARGRHGEADHAGARRQVAQRGLRRRRPRRGRTRRRGRHLLQQGRGLRRRLAHARRAQGGRGAGRKDEGARGQAHPRRHARSQDAARPADLRRAVEERALVCGPGQGGGRQARRGRRAQHVRRVPAISCSRRSSPTRRTR